MLTREELITEVYEQEMQRFIELSVDFEDKPKKGYEVEWQDCKERLEILEQMLLEIPMDYILNNKETGLIKQEFIGTIDNEPELYYDCNDVSKRYYYADMTIMGCGDENVYKRRELLRLSNKVWFDWFFNFRYEKEKKVRIAKGLCTYIKATVIDGEVRKLKWYKRYCNKYSKKGRH